MERVAAPLSQSAIVESLHSDHSSLYSMTLSNISYTKGQLSKKCRRKIAIFFFIHQFKHVF